MASAVSKGTNCLAGLELQLISVQVRTSVPLFFCTGRGTVCGEAQVTLIESNRDTKER